MMIVPLASPGLWRTGLATLGFGLWALLSLPAQSASRASEAESRLIERLESKDLSERQEAARALASMASVRSIPALIEFQEREEHGPTTGWLDTVEPVRAALMSIIDQKGPAVVAPLVAVLQNARPGLREHAVEYLGELGPEAAETIPVIEGFLKRKDLGSILRARSAESLFEIGSDRDSFLPVLLESCRDGDLQVQFYASATIQRMGPAGLPAISGLIACLEMGPHSRSSNVAAEVLRDLGAVGPVTELTTRSRGDVRATAVRVLGDLGAQAAVPTLLICLEDEDPGVFVAAAQALGKIGKKVPQAIPTLIRRMKEPDADGQVAVLDALGQVGSGSGEGELVSFLVGSMKRGAIWIRFAAARALGRMGKTATVVAALRNAATWDPQREVRAWASWALVNLGSRKADRLVLDMIAWLETRDSLTPFQVLEELGPAAKLAVPSLVRIAARKLPPGLAWDCDLDFASAALSRIGLDAEEAQPLIDGLKDADPRHRWQTLVVLGTIGRAGKVTVGAVVDSLRDPDPVVRAKAAEALGKIGPDARAAVPALKGMLSARDKEIRHQARKALAILAGSSRPEVTPRNP